MLADVRLTVRWKEVVKEQKEVKYPVNMQCFKILRAHIMGFLCHRR